LKELKAKVLSGKMTSREFGILTGQPFDDEDIEEKV
jgi:hypothetical protein